MNKVLNSGWFWGIITGLVFVFLLINWCNKASAQSVTRQGNVFIQDTSKSAKIKKDNPTLTKYFYLAADGIKYPIYMSASGKCFIIRISKNGKGYRQYLPEVTKQLQENETSNQTTQRRLIILI